MTAQELKDYIDQVWSRVGSDRVSSADLRDVGKKLVDFAAALDIEDSIPDWTAGLTFQTDGSDDGKYCKHPDTNGKKRLFETKTDNNIGNEPPTNPLITENDDWQEISPSSAAAIPEWQPGVFGAGLVIVYHNHSLNGRGLYVLLEPVRPFTSLNIETEITAGQWAQIAGSAKQTIDALNIVAGPPDTLTIDCADNDSKTVRYSASDDHTVVLTNASSLIVLHVHARLSNTQTIQFPSNVRSLLEQPGGVSWDDANQQLTIEAVTNEDWEFSLTQVNFGSGDIFKLKVSGPYT